MAVRSGSDPDCILEASEETGPTDLALVRNAEHLAKLAEIERRTASIRLEDAEANPAAIDASVREVRELAEAALEVLVSLQALDEARHGVTDDGNDDYELVWLEERSQVFAPPRIADLCFGGTFELRRVLRALNDAEAPDDRLVAVETARRKLRRALRAVLSAAHLDDSAPVTRDPQSLDGSELEAALSVRGIYARFRRSLRRPPDETPESVLEAVRYAVGALAMLVASPDYTLVRASDRAILRRLRERGLAWARRDRPIDGGLQLLEDVWTCADLLRGINRRQELKLHDEFLIHELLAGTDAGTRGWFQKAETLLGLDDALDALLESRKGDTEDAALAGDVRKRLEQLA